MLLAVAVRAPGREVGEEVRDVAAVRLDRAHAARARQEHPVLQQVGAVGVERVARQPALELEVGEEVEHERLEARLDRGLGLGWPDCDGHAEVVLPAGGASLPLHARVRAASAAWTCASSQATISAMISGSCSGSLRISWRSPS